MLNKLKLMYKSINSMSFCYLYCCNVHFVEPFNYHTNNCTYIKVHIKTLKIAPTCFDPKIIFRELHCSLLKSHFRKPSLINFLILTWCCGSVSYCVSRTRTAYGLHNTCTTCCHSTKEINQ